MASGELKRQLMGMFLQEVRERTQELERDLLALETESDPAARMAIIERLLRHTHSLKGTAGLVEERSIEAVCHWMEELFIAVRDRRRELDEAMQGLLLGATNAIAEAGRRLSRGESAEAGPLGAILPQLVTAGQRDQDGLDALGRPTAQSPAQEPDVRRRDGAPDGIATYIRVPIERLDTLLSECGELLVARYRSQRRIDQINTLQDSLKNVCIDRSTDAGPDRTLLLQLTARLQDLATQFQEDHRIIDRTTTTLEAEVRQIRMQPFERACEGLDDLVRDFGPRLGKRAQLRVEGGDLRVDRSIIESLRDLLRHLVRNALDHGLEPAEERKAAGKPGTGRIKITAVSLGDRVQISVADDGRGLNLAAIREQIHRSGVANVDDERELLRQIFMPGFSTASVATQVSGRGVGLDIVKSAIEGMRGTVNISQAPGKGTTFTLVLPLTLTVIRALLVESGGHIFAFDTAAVQRIIRFFHADIRSVQGQPVVLTDDQPMPILELSGWLGLPPSPDSRGDRAYSAIVLTTLGREIAVVVDEVLAEQECLLRSLGPRLQKIRNYSGGTILPNGRVALVLNAAAVAEEAISHEPRRDFASTAKGKMEKLSVLVADDSITTRTLVQTILESAGYDVATAADGAEAWQIVQTQEIQAVISDVDMPRMDGFMLTEAIRGAMGYKDLPVILVTSQEREEDRRRGLEAGADAYLLKSAFDQRQLLETLAQFV